jgi:hypothetical protein
MKEVLVEGKKNKKPVGHMKPACSKFYNPITGFLFIFLNSGL